MPTTTSSKEWVKRPCPENQVLELVRRLAVSPSVARILVSRGVGDPERAAGFLQTGSQPYHDPYLLPGIDAFLARIEQAIRKKEKIVIHGDYDADGITSAAILHYALTRVGLHPDIFLPNRFDTGYGIHPDWVMGAAAEGYRLVVSCDCGSSAEEACRKAVELGLDLIVTDHHAPRPDLPGVIAHINPHLPDSRYPFADLSGAGVALKLAQALQTLVPPSFQSRYRGDLPVELAMIGCVADVMPLLDENRRIVIDGLDQIRTRPRQGLLALLRSAQSDPAGVNCETIAFQVAPRLNAAGRLGSPRLAFELLVEDDAEKAAEHALELEEINSERKRLAQLATEDALGKVRAEKEKVCAVLLSPEWNRGILGIVAARVLDETGLPAFVACLEGDMAHGSARTPEGIDAVRILEAARDHTTRSGGHPGAAGFTVPQGQWEDFKNVVRGAVQHEEAEAVAPQLEIDAFLDSKENLLDLLREVSTLDPFGHGFPAPTYTICRIDSSFRHSVFGKNHLRIQLNKSGEPLEAIGFGMGEWSKTLSRQNVDLAIAFGENHWNGKTSIRPRILDIRPSLHESSESPGSEGVARIESPDRIHRATLWDARGRSPLEDGGYLRIGYGPDWRDWWVGALPGKIGSWKERLWLEFKALPPCDWPPGDAAAYGERTPEDWGGRVLEILWPPLRGEDRDWLRDLVDSLEEPPLVRIAYDPNQIEAWFQPLKTNLEREHLAVLYRNIKGETVIPRLFDLPLPAATVGLGLETLADLGLVGVEGESVRIIPNQPKRDFKNSDFYQRWKKFQKRMLGWRNRAIEKPVETFALTWFAEKETTHAESKR